MANMLRKNLAFIMSVRQLYNLHSKTRPAPNITTNFWVAGWHPMGFLPFDVIHIRQRVPGCWEWYLSSNWRFKLSLEIRIPSFFIYPAIFRIGLSNDWTQFAHRKDHLLKGQMALPHALRLRRLQQIQIKRLPFRSAQCRKLSRMLLP